MSTKELGLGDTLALDRTRMGVERTLMAWVRTALSLISFGFTIYKFLQAMQAQSPVIGDQPHAPRVVALTLIGIGTVALVAACFQYQNHLKRLFPDEPRSFRDLAFLVACSLGLLGILMFGSIILNSGPFD